MFAQSIALLVFASALSLPVSAAEPEVGTLPAFTELSLPDSPVYLNSTFTVTLMPNFKTYGDAIRYTTVTITYPNGTTLQSGSTGEPTLVPIKDESCEFSPGLRNFDTVASDLGAYKITINQTIGYPDKADTREREFSCSPPLNYQSSFIEKDFEVVGPAAPDHSYRAAAVTRDYTWAPAPTGMVTMVSSGNSNSLEIRNIVVGTVVGLAASGLWLGM